MKSTNQNISTNLKEIRFSPSLHSIHQEQGRRRGGDVGGEYGTEAGEGRAGGIVKEGEEGE